MIYYLLMSAGKQSRYGDKMPKALVDINGKPLLDRNIENVRPFADNCIIVCSNQNQDYFANYDKIIIDSGYGCGDAVMKALNNIKPNDNDLCIIQWGDSLQEPKLYKDMLNNVKDGILIPCNYEIKPYVQIIPYQNTVKALFYKYGDNVSNGLHDQSVFIAPAKYLQYELNMFAKKIKTKEGYVHKHNNEMLFLDLFNERQTRANILLNTYKTIAFNTKKEFEKLKIK